MTLNSKLDAAGMPHLLDELTTLVSAAAAAVLKARSGGLHTRAKADLSPVTAADEASEAIILEGVARLLPRVPVVSEERILKTPLTEVGDCVVLVDPVDGTRELVAGRDEFTINLGIASGGRPVLGVIAAPAFGLIWRAAEGGPAERMRLPPGGPAAAASDRVRIKTRPLTQGKLVATVSRSHLDGDTLALLDRLAPTERLLSGSAIKLCKVAEGTADLYPRLAPVREWDVAAGHAILAAAGGVVIGADGSSLSYGHLDQDFRVNGFVAWSDPQAPAKLGYGPSPVATA